MHFPGGHTCTGCFIIIDDCARYIPQLKVDAHTTILDTTSRTTLTQTYINPHSEKAISELKYVFPLYDGVSVVGFTCTVGKRVIKGVVKEREKAKQVYNEAKARGETAGLFEQSLEAADVFTTTIGNVPAGEKVKVEITYLGELKHDAEVDGVRFTIPSYIVPRYGKTNSLTGSTIFQEEGMTFTVDAEMPEGSAIKSIQSPSHPISVSIGTLSISKESDEPSLRKASATLSTGAASMDTDFIIQVVATKLGEPAAFVETHPTIPNQRALMATLVPKFKLPTDKPEIVFMCDRSGSMGRNMPDLVAALNIFLKSLPLGVKFNICSFGSSFRFLWNKSKTYSQESLDEAVRHVNTFQADMGGTEMYNAVKAIFDKRYNDINLELFLLTDGEIWDQANLFELINSKVAETKGDVRVFSLGVGDGASTSLIEGVARAGNGFSQSVKNGEKMDKKVVRMLKVSLFPHIKDYSLEIKYGKAEAKTTDDEEFEIVDKVFDSLSIRTLVQEEPEKKKEEKEKPAISLFNRDVDDDDDTNMVDAPDAVEAKYDHLSAIAAPRYLQTPTDIPPLFPFNRTTVYVLLSDSDLSMKPKSVILKGACKHGPLELEIPIVNLPEKSTTIHQLAARKEVKELEEGRGWLSRAKDESGKLLKEKHEAHFSDMVEREAVRLGVEYQVGGKWCSFVAVEEQDSVTKDLEELSVQIAEAERQIESSYIAARRSARGGQYRHRMMSSSSGLFGSSTKSSTKSSGGLFGNANPSPGGTAFGFGTNANTGGGLFGNNNTNASYSAQNYSLEKSAKSKSGGLFGGGGLFGNSSSSSGPTTTAFGMQNSAPPRPSAGGLFGNNSSAPAPRSSGSLFGSVGSAFKRKSSSSSAPPPPPAPTGSLFGAPPAPAASLFGASAASAPPPPPPGGLFRAEPERSAQASTGGGFGSTSISAPFGSMSAAPQMQQPFGAPAPPPMFGSAQAPPPPAPGMAAFGGMELAQPLQSGDVLNDFDFDSFLHEQDECKSEEASSMASSIASKSKESKEKKKSKAASPKVDTANALQALATLQTFVGTWDWNSSLETILGTNCAAASALALPSNVAGHNNKDTILATVCAVVYFKKMLKSEKEAWELLVEKAEAWLEDQIDGGVEDLEDIIGALF